MRLDSSHTIVKMPTRRGSAPRFALPLLMVATASWLAGCATMAPKPKQAADLDQPHLVLRLGERRLYLKDGGVAQPPEGFLVAVGKPQYPTPVGRFSINEMVVNPDFTVFDFNNTSGPNRGKIPLRGSTTRWAFAGSGSRTITAGPSGSTGRPRRSFSARR